MAGEGRDGRPYPAGVRGWAGPGPGGVPLAALCERWARLGRTGGHAAGVEAVWLLLVPAGAAMARVDLAVFRLPDVLTLPAGVGTAARLGVCALVPGTRVRGRCVARRGALLGLYFVLHLVNPGGMGFGDVKLAPTLGMALGWYGWEAVYRRYVRGLRPGGGGLALLALRRADRKTAIPFGPFMLLGALGGVSSPGRLGP